jgi:hypothetical protein
MERESVGTKYIVANCEGSQSPPSTVELRKKEDFNRYTFIVIMK